MSNKQYTVPTGSAPGSGGGGGGSGTVTSVALADSTGLFTVTGSPVTTSGTLTLSAFANQTANRVLAGPTSGGAAASSFRALVAADLPAGTGTVTSVGQTVNGGASSGIFAVTGSPVTTSGTIDIATAGTSGGVPYFSSGTVVSSSGALTANRLVLGGGAGAAPTVVASLGTTTTVLHGNAGGAPTFGAVVLTTDVSGVLPPANGGVANVTTLGGSFLAISDYPLSSMQPNLIVQGGTANKIEGVVFNQRNILVVGHMSVRNTTSLGAASHWSEGIYDSGGNLVFWTGALDGTVTTLQTVTAKDSAGNPTSYTMNPGTYYLVTTATVAGAGNTEAFAFSPSSAVVLQYINNANANRQIISATNTTNGVLPAAIGTLSVNNTALAITGTFVEP